MDERFDAFRRRGKALFKGVRSRMRAVAKERPTSWSANVVRRAAIEHFAENLLMQPRYADARSLARNELQVFSQGGEDGVLVEIFRRIGVSDRRFVEIGVGNGIETNTTFLLLLGWSGVWVESGRSSVAEAERLFASYVKQNRLNIIGQAASAENVEELLKRANVSTEFDLLAVDIDMNTYYIWEALHSLRPRVVVVEYNASIPPTVEWKVPYSPSKQWNETIYFGAGLKSYELLGDRLGYSLVYCNLAGVNAFFVRNDLLGDSFVAPFTAERHYEPPRYWLHWRFGHRAGME